MDKEAAEKALSAVNDASGQVALAWASFLSFGTYLAVTIGSTTHLDLLLGRQILLPVLGVNLGLVTFYWAAPLLFLLFHIYFLIQFYALAGKIHAFNALVASAEPDVVKTLRARLHIVMLTQALAGPRAGFVATMVRQMTLWLSAVILPVFLLILFLVKFLPYHDEVMTWWHRLAIFIDVGFLFFLWPIIFHPSGAMRPIWKDARRRWRALFRPASTDARGEHVRGVRQSVVAIGLVSLIFLVIVPAVVVVATIPEEWLERRTIALAEAALPSAVVDDGKEPVPRKMLAVTAWLFEGPINNVTLAPQSLFTRNLVIVQQDLVDDAGFEKVEHSLNLRGRRLENAVFTGSDLHKADLSGASLYRATLRDTNLQGASLACPADALAGDCTSLQFANLQGVKLQGASLWRTNLRDAMLAGAQFQGADLGEAQLAGSFKNAAFDGAFLGGAFFNRTRDLQNRAFATASWANMKDYPDPRLRTALRKCTNEDSSSDFLYVSRPLWLRDCEPFPYPEPSLEAVLSLYQQAATAVRDALTRERVRQGLIGMVKQTTACRAAQQAKAQQVNAVATDLPNDGLPADIREFYSQVACFDLAAIKGPGQANAGNVIQTSTETVAKEQ